MDLETIKKQDNSWWLKHLKDTSVFDVKLIKEQFDWLVLQAEKVERYEESLKLIHKNATSGHVRGIVKRTLGEDKFADRDFIVGDEVIVKNVYGTGIGSEYVNKIGIIVDIDDDIYTDLLPYVVKFSNCREFTFNKSNIELHFS